MLLICKKHNYNIFSETHHPVPACRFTGHPVLSRMIMMIYISSNSPELLRHGVPLQRAAGAVPRAGGLQPQRAVRQRGHQRRAVRLHGRCALPSHRQLHRAAQRVQEHQPRLVPPRQLQGRALRKQYA